MAEVQPLKVLTVTSSFPRYERDYYGNFIYDMCRRLVRNRVDVTVLAPRSRSTTGPLGGLEVKRFPFMPSPRLETLPEQTLKHASPRELLQLPSYLCSAYLHMVGEPADIVHAHLAIPMGFLAALSPRSTPLVIICHGSDCTLSLAKPAYRAFVEYALRRADRVVAVSEFVRGLALRLGAPEEKVEVIYLGIDAEKFKPTSDRDAVREEVGVPVDRLVVGTLGRLVPEKRVEDLIRAAARINREVDAYFVVGGDGFHRPYLERLAGELNIENIRFLGEIRDAARFHQLCDIFVLTSIGEGLSISLQEAMATGCFPVAVNGYGCPELIRDGENGYLFEPMDVEGLAEKVLKAADSLKLGRRARATMLDRFDMDRNALRYVELYGELVSRGRA